jgi:predicted KAP-like P-loop ATPase
MELEDNVIYFKLSVDEEVGAMSLEILDNTIEGSTISNLLSPLAKGISNILEQDPDFLYEAGSQISEGEYVETNSETMH